MSASPTVSSRLVLKEGKYFYLQIVFLVDFLHELVHFGAFWIWVLPELSWDGERVHF
jgi:hypothetical protein